MSGAVSRGRFDYRRRMRLMIACLCVAALVVGTAAAGVGAASHQTWYVDDDGTGTPSSCDGREIIPSTIQQGVDAAANGDRVLVCPGVYIGPIDISKNGLVVRAKLGAKAMVLAASNHTSGEPLITIHDASNVKLKNLRIVAPTAAPCAQVGSLIYIQDAPNTEIKGNKLSVLGNEGLGSCGYQIGVFVNGQSQFSRVIYNKITDFGAVGIQMSADDTKAKRNTINFFHPGHVYSDNPNAVGVNLTQFVTRARVIDNVIRSLPTAGDTPRLGWGVYSFRGFGIVEGNFVRHATRAFGWFGGDGTYISDNTAVVDITIGIEFDSIAEATVTGNDIEGEELGISLTNSIANTITGNDFRGPSDPDCTDDSEGQGSYGTSNIWEDNQGHTSWPSGICSPVEQQEQ